MSGRRATQGLLGLAIGLALVARLAQITSRQREIYGDIAIVYWNTIYIQRALDELGYRLASDELAGLTPTLFEHVNALGTYDFSTERPAGQLRPLRAASAA